MEPQPPVEESPQYPLQPLPKDEPQSNKRAIVLVAIVAGLLLIVLGVLLAHHNKSNSANNAANTVLNLNHPEDHTYETTVTLTQDNFTPSTVTVKAGTEVYFDNKSTNAEGEAGGPRRIVQSKAASDQAKYFASDPLTATSEYGYTFRVPGTYQFYDADNVSSTLTIIVQK